MILQSNLKKLDNTYKPEKTFEQEFCDHFSNRFTVPFGKVETDPDIVDGKDCALEAQKYFHAARTFGKNNHPAYDFEDLEKYVTAKVKELLNPLNADVMKYIQILRYLNPKSQYAFPECDGFAALQIKMAERRVAAESISTTNGPLCMETIKALGDDQIEVLIEKCSKFLKSPEFDLSKLDAATSNKYLLELVKLAKGMGDTAQSWMNCGFNIRKSPEFYTFVCKQLTLPDRSKLTKAMSLASTYHDSLFGFWKMCGFSDDADKHLLDGELACFLKEAFVSTDQNVLHNIIEFASADALESVDGFVTFFESNVDLGNALTMSFSKSSSYYNKHSSFYRLIKAQRMERRLSKTVIMDAPKDAKEWFDRVETYHRNKLAPVLSMAKYKEEAAKAKNDMLPDGEKDNSDKIDTIYRPAVVLKDMKEKSNDILRQCNNYMQTLGISADITTALNDMKSYETGQAEFYKFLETNRKILEYSVHGFDSEHAIQDAIKFIKQSKVLFEQIELFDRVSRIVSIFYKDADGCVLLKADGSIVCDNKYMESKLRELEEDDTWDGHMYLNQFLSDARSLNSANDVRNLVRTFLAAEKADCDTEIKQQHEWFGYYLSQDFY